MSDRNVEIDNFHLIVRYLSACQDCPVILRTLRQVMLTNFPQVNYGRGIINVECTDGPGDELKKLIIRGSVNGQLFKREHVSNVSECSPKPKKAAGN